MSDEYQLRKDIDKIYFRVFDVENDQLAIYTKDEINEILKSNYYDISDIDIKFDSLIDLILEILELIDPKTLTALSINVPLDLVYSDEFNITGTLLDANNNPIGSARVSLLVGNTIVDTKTTNNQGVVLFTQTPVHTGNHTFQLRYTGDTTYKASSSSIVSRVVGKETSVLTLNNPVEGASYGVDGTVTITGLLTDNDGTPLANKIITVSNGLSYTTSSNGSFTGSTSYSTSGEYTLTFTYVGDDNYTASTVTRNIIVNEQVVYDDIILTSDKSILSSYDSDTCTLTAQLMNGSDTASVQDEIVTFYQDGTLIDTSLTDATGKAQYVYSSQGIGDTVFEAKVGSLSSETYAIQDCSYYNTAEVTRSSTNGSTIYDNNLSQSLPSKCEISFDLYSNNSSDNGEHRFFLLPKSQYSSSTTQPTNAIYVDAMKTKMRIGKRESSTVGLYQNLAYGSGSYRNFKIIKDGTDLTFYIDDNLIGTSTISWIDNHSDYCLSMMRWTTSGTSKIKNVKFKPL